MQFARRMYGQFCRALSERENLLSLVPAWVTSMLLHVALLLMLAVWTLYQPPSASLLDLTASLDEQIDPEIPDQLATLNEEAVLPGTDSHLSSNSAASTVAELSPETELPSPEIPTDQGTVEILENIVVPMGPQLRELEQTYGVAGAGVTGTEGAIDRITQEILRSLELNETLVVWLFDRSGSLARQRKAIQKRFDRVYEELGVLESSGNEAFRKHKDKPLLTSVLGFGQSTELLIDQPTDDVEVIKKAVASIETDESGDENVFSALIDAARKFRSYRTRRPRRNVMIIIVTDESGSDQQRLEEAVQTCQQSDIPVYVIGVPAPFGQRQAFVKYVDPDRRYDQTPRRVPVDQGPESLRPEALKIHFAGYSKYESLDSGFGPFALTRLCYATGGIYFAVHPNRELNHRITWRELEVLSPQISKFFDPDIMRSYRPNYVSVSQLGRLLKENLARAALVTAAERSWISPMEDPRLVFPSVNEAQFNNLLTLAQRQAAKLEPQIDQLYLILKQGSSDRPTLTGLRWQAGFDLAMGRVLAMKVRTVSYNAMLAKAKGGMKFENPRSDTWVLRPAESITVGSQLEKESRLAKEYLHRVVDQHGGTPWAELAGRELSRPLGWKWGERFTGVAPEQRNNNASTPRTNRPDEQARKIKRPKQRPLPKL